VDLGLLEEREFPDLAGLTYAEFLASLIGKKGRATRADVAAFLGLPPVHFILGHLEWLGLFSEEKVPAGCASSLDVLTATMLARMQYAPGERDMLVLQHQFLAEYPNHKERITSTMIDLAFPAATPA